MKNIDKLIIAGDGFSRESPTAPGKLAEHLEREILGGRYAIGDFLPSERSLMVDFKLSRTVVREALRILATGGLIQVRRGRSGGSYVSGPNHRTATRSLYLLVNGEKFRLVDLLAVREGIEPMAAAQAAVFRTEADVRELRRLCQACEDYVEQQAKFIDANLEWHMAVIGASKNPLFAAFMESIALPLREASDFDIFDADVRRIVAHAHWRIFAAIEAMDSDAAKRRMTHHVQTYKEEVKDMDKSLLPRLSMSELDRNLANSRPPNRNNTDGKKNE